VTDEVTETIRNALSELKKGLQSIYGSRLVAVILYGSTARGEFKEGSDVDVAIVLRGSFPVAEEIDQVSALVSEISLRYNVTISILPIPESWWRERQSPLLINLRREGVML